MSRESRNEIRESFLRHQHAAITELAAHSDVVEILQHSQVPPEAYILRFHCKGLVKTEAGIEEADWFDVGIRFPEDYQRRIEIAEVVTVLWPPTIFHPNIRFPFVCLGNVRPGTDLKDLVYQLYEIITFHNFGMNEGNALNAEACSWARRNQERFPLERRPLRRRTLALTIHDGPHETAPSMNSARGEADHDARSAPVE